MKIWLIALLLFCVGTQAAPTADATLERLAKVSTFAFGGVGFAGVTSLGEKDYKVILSRPSALADFEKLFSSGNLMAKCYALVGIRKLSPGRFEELAKPLRASRDKVMTMHGCIVASEPLGAIVGQIESTKYSN